MVYVYYQQDSVCPVVCYEEHLTLNPNNEHEKIDGVRSRPSKYNNLY